MELALKIIEFIDVMIFVVSVCFMDSESNIFFEICVVSGLIFVCTFLIDYFVYEQKRK